MGNYHKGKGKSVSGVFKTSLNFKDVSNPIGHTLKFWRWAIKKIAFMKILDTKLLQDNSPPIL